MNPKISIILPVYNAEKYIRQTLDSVLSQTFHDFEVVAVNDGSTDSSLGILMSYRESDERIKVIDKPNTGVSDTRNVAIKEAEGEYLAFLDSDDIYAPEYLERMYLAALEKCADVVVCDYVTFRGNAPVFGDNERGEATDVSIRELLDTGLMTSMCVKLVRKSFFENADVRFDTALSFGEDLFVAWKACLASGKTVKIADKLYGYRMSTGGATAKYHPNLYEKYKSAFEDLKQYAIGIGVSESDLLDIDIHFVKRLPTFSFMCARSKGGVISKIKRIKHILGDSTIRDVCEKHFDELVRGEGKKQIALYKSAKRRSARGGYLFGAKMELRLKLSRLKRRLRGR